MSIKEYSQDSSTAPVEEKKYNSSAIADYSKAGVSGIGTGLLSLLSAPEELTNLGLLGIDVVGKKLGFVDKDKPTPSVDIPLMPSFSEIDNFRKTGQFYYPKILTDVQNKQTMGTAKIPMYENTIGKVLNYQPERKGAEYLSVGAEWATPSGILGKAGKVRTAIPMTISGGAGVTSKGLEEAGFDKSAPFIGLGIDLFGNIFASQFGNPKYIQKIQSIVDELANNGQLDEAKALITDAKKYGVDLSAPEAIQQTSGNTTLTEMMGDVAGTPEGSVVLNKFTKDRFKTITDENLNFLNKYFGDVDLDTINIDDVSNQFVNTLRKSKEDLEKAINDRARNLKNGGWKVFDKNNNLQSSISAYLDGLQNRIVKGKVSNREVLQDVRSKFTSKDISDLSNSNLQDAYQALLSQADELVASGNSKKALLYRAEANNIKQILDTNEYFARATEFTKRAYEKLGARFDGVTVGGRINNNINNPTLNIMQSVLFGKDISPINITRLANELNKVDKTIFPEMANIVLQKMFQNLDDATDNIRIGSKLYKSLFGKGNENKFKAIVDGVAKAKGIDGNVLFNEYKKLFNIFDATGNLPNVGSRTSPKSELYKDLRDIGINNLDLAEPLKIITKPIEDAVSSKRAGELMEIFFADDSIDQLIKLSKNKTKKKYIANLSAFLTRVSSQIGQLNVKEEEGQQNKSTFTKQGNLRIYE